MTDAECVPSRIVGGIARGGWIPASERRATVSRGVETFTSAGKNYDRKAATEAGHRIFMGCPGLAWTLHLLGNDAESFPSGTGPLVDILCH
jgi:hypothetical protein